MIFFSLRLQVSSIELTCDFLHLGCGSAAKRRSRFKHASIFVCVAMLPSLALQHTSVRPYQRGLYCGDSSLSYPYQKSTVPSSVLTAVGLTLPFVSVSPAHKQGAHVSGNTEAEIGRVGGC